MDLDLGGKRALITGGSAGIGKAIADRLAAEGCELVLAARSAERLNAVAQEITKRTGAVVTPIISDLSQGPDQARLAEICEPIDILVNVAGSNPAGQIDEISDELWRQSWDLKVFGYINLIRLIYPKMKERRSGVIVNIIGNSGEKMNAQYILGSSGNLALMGLTRALGGRSPDFGVRVVGINPGLTNSERADTLLRGWSKIRFGTEERSEEVLAGMDLPFGRMCNVNEIADLAAFLASPRAGYISGTIVTSDGGASNRN
jgi:3-oxoacyl-[acyl-carrier protein] reductase